ncbi:MAG: divergent polysaccharide deacetylase family protein, partial [Gammaproteobacteria bacterium]
MTRAHKLILAGIFFLTPIHFLSADSPAIAIIIDDIGHSLEAGERVVNSNWSYTCSILPARPYSIELAKSAYQSGKEVIVHLPM